MRSDTRRPLDEKRDPAREVELQRLIAEQAADDTYQVSQKAAISWDQKPKTDNHWDALEETQGEVDHTLSRLLGEHVEAASAHQPGLVTPERVKDWRHLRNAKGWVYREIADYAGVDVKTVRKHIVAKSKYGRISEPRRYLLKRRAELRKAYEAGAFLREIAQVHYEDAGYKSWQSCYQALREVLREDGVELRPKSAPRHGMRSREASPQEQKRYWKHNNERAKKRRQQQLVRCDAVTKEGRPCRRWAVLGGRFCVTHDERTKPPTKWTREVVIEALKSWATTHGRPPQHEDWLHATAEHPNFSTVAELFGKWNFALYDAGLRERKHPKPQRRHARLAKGYKFCDREGCENTVPPSWRYCKDRHCQDARSPWNA